VARRFNHLYGREPDFEENALAAIKKMGKKSASLYNNLRKAYLETGDGEALERAQALLKEQQNISLGDTERLFGYLEGSGKMILAEPQSLLTRAPKMPGLDGRKMSKSYDNIISLREEDDVISQKIKTMPTDPARVRLTDPGSPENCPVWEFHEIYSDEKTCQWVQDGCRSASIGCLECKKPVIDAVTHEIEPIRERAKELEENIGMVKSVIAEGSEKAREVARETMSDVRQAMGLNYR